MSFAAVTRPRRCLAVIGGALTAVIAVSAVTATLADDASAAGASPSPITDADIAQAGIGVMAFGLRNLGVEPITEACPVLTQDQLGSYFTQHGYTPNFTRFSVDAYYEDDIGAGYPGLDCLSEIEDAVDPDPVAPHYPAVGAAYLPEGVTFADFLTGFEGQTILTPSVPTVGGEIGGVCIPNFCYLHWHRASLVVTVLVAGGTGDITREKTEAMLTSMIPDVVTNLIASLDLGMTATASTTSPTVAPPTTVAAPTTIAPPTTVVPATAVPTTTVPATTLGPTTTNALPSLPELPSSSVPAPTKTTPA
jgi:hypothetical protein